MPNNIDFIYDTDDNTLETINASGFVLNQGQAGGVVFRFFFKDFSPHPAPPVSLTAAQIIDRQCLINIERPNGTASNNIVASPNVTDLCYNLNISDWALALPGTLKITARLFNPVTEVTTNFGLATKQILASASVSLDTIEDQQYQAILDVLSNMTSAIYIVVANENIAEGDLVTFAGTTGEGGRVIVRKARASGAFNINTNPELIFGVAQVAILANAEGSVITNGFLRNIDTSAYTQGAILYPNTAVAGGLTNTIGEAPNNRTPIAVSIYSHATEGILLIRPTIKPTLNQISDVNSTEVATHGNNSVLKYNSSTLRWEVIDGRTQFSTIYYNANQPTEAQTFDGMIWLDVL